VRDAILVVGDYFKILGNILTNFSQGSSTYSGLQLKGDFNTAMNNTFESYSVPGYSHTKFRHIYVFQNTSGNRIVNNFMDSNSILDSGVNTQNAGNVYP